jgi:hypothetical protein
MQRKTFVAKLIDAGDGYLNYIGSESTKLKYYIGTLNFKTKYVRDKFVEKFGKEPPSIKSVKNDNSERLLVFCWDLDDFKSINPEKIISITPLSAVLNETSPWKMQT